MPRPISTADAQLLDALDAVGFHDVRKLPGRWKRRLEDWRHDGLYPQAERQFPGGGGSSARYPDETVAQVVELAQLMEERARKDEAALLLFYRGRAISEETARRAHLSTIHRLDTYLKSFSNSDDEYEIAEAAALGLTRKMHRSKQGRGMLSELQQGTSADDDLHGAGESVESLLASALTNALLVLRSGTFSTEEGLLELLKSVRLLLPAFGAEDDRWTQGWALPDLVELLRCASITRQARAIEHARAADLLRARHDIPNLLAFAGQIAELLHRDSARRILNLPALSERIAARTVPGLLSTYESSPWIAEALALLRDGAVGTEILQVVATVVMKPTADDNLVAMT